MKIIKNLLPLFIWLSGIPVCYFMARKYSIKTRTELGLKVKYPEGTKYMNMASSGIISWVGVGILGLITTIEYCDGLNNEAL